MIREIFELSPDGYRGDLMNEVSKFRYYEIEDLKYVG